MTITFDMNIKDFFMDSNWEIIGKEGLQFFGKMSASISHEIKNVLAIINENAGLLEDFTLLAEKGRPVEMERFKTLAGKIKNQVVRANDIIKNLNRFAHSADAFIEKIDLNEMLGFVVGLSGRLADMKGVSFEQKVVDKPVTITTSPFFLQNLLWFCLEFVMETANPDKSVDLLVEKMESGVRISFSNLLNIEEIQGERFPFPRKEAIMNALGAQISFDDGKGELILLLPDDVEH